MAVRRVRRIIRKIDPWTVLKASMVFNAVGALVFVLGTWVVWSMALQRGIPERIVSIFESLTLTLTIDGELYFRVVVLLAVVGSILATALMTLGAVLYNLISDLVGGVEVTVLEETYNTVQLAQAPRVAPSLYRPNGGNGAHTVTGEVPAQPADVPARGQ
jgi:Transmembrane domain of unknown function (DUF3566)